MKRYEHLIIYIIVIISVIVVYHYFTRLSIQKVFNESLYTGDRKLEEIVDIPEKVKEEIKLGKEKLSKTKLIIAGCLRDREDHIHRIQKITESIGSLAADYRILIVENDSSDRTRELLLEWAKTNPRVEILGCGVNAQECKLNLPRTVQWDVNHSRMNKMRTIREICLDRIKEKYYSFDQLLLIDPDLEGSIHEQGIMHACYIIGKQFGKGYVSAVGALGQYNFAFGKYYYDPFAFVAMSKEEATKEWGVTDHSCWTYTTNPVKYMWNLSLEPGELVPCKSAFAGAALYEISSILSATYHVKEGEDPLECEHVTFNRNISGVMVVDGTMILSVLENPRFS